MIKLSIIVPVYNVEKYIRPCFESIFKQGLNDDEYEIIIVNDGSTDRSMDMIVDIIKQHSNITIISQDNQGLSVARNNGIRIAKGEYILMPDSDDMLIENSLPPLLAIALKTKVDLVVADFIKIDADDTYSTLYNQNGCNYHVKQGIDIFLEDLNPDECYVWRTLYKKEFLINNNISFVPGVRYQDVPYTHECFLKANNCIRTNWLLNIYRVGRTGSATESFNEKKASEYVTVIAKTWELRYLNGITPKITRKIEDDVYRSFSALIFFLSRNRNQINNSKIFNLIKSKIPNLHFYNNPKQILSTFLFYTSPMILIWFRRFYSVCIEDILLPSIRKKRINTAQI